MEQSHLWPMTKAEMTKDWDLFQGIIERGTQSRYDMNASKHICYDPEHLYKSDRYAQVAKRVEGKLELVRPLPEKMWFLEPIYDDNNRTTIETLGMCIIGKKASPWDKLLRHTGIRRDYAGYVPWAKYLLHM